MQATKSLLDFIVIGAQKAGTTSLFEYLRRHPELCLPSDKEAPYFSHDSVHARGWEDYIKRVAFADPACKWGTVTPHYMVGAAYESSIGCGYDEHTVPLRIKERLPTVRLVAILRDPVERARSHHLMASMNGLERRPFDEAIEELLQPGSLLRDRQSPSEDAGYVVWGEYGRILSGYFDVFPAEQILIVFTDELNAAPERLLHRVHEFIGVTPDIMPDNLGTRYREGSATRRFLGVDAYAAQGAVRRNRVTRFVWHALPEASRLWADRGFTHLAYRADLLNRRNGCDPEEPAASTLTRLRDHFARDSDLLATLLGDTPPWQQSEASA